MSPSPFLRWVFGLAIAALLTVAPFVHYRETYGERKRLREVTPGVLYRSGQMTGEGFAKAVSRFGIRTVINLQDDYPDPRIEQSFLHRTTTKESDLCKQIGVRYVQISPDLIPRRLIPAQRPAAIDQLLAVLDDPASYPVLLHCRAGLHRTGVLTAVYRMEYEGWTHQDALEEVLRNGFGEYPCTAANDYVRQYVLSYRPGLRMQPYAPASLARAALP